MSISIDKIMRQSNNTIQPMQVKNSKSTVTASGKKFDEVMISSSAQQIQERKLAEELEKNVISQIQKQPSNGDVETLRQAVALGTYKPSAEDIASRILLEEGTY